MTTLSADVGGCRSPKLENSCWPGSRGSKPCRPGSSSQPSQPDTGTNRAVQDLKVGSRRDSSRRGQKRHWRQMANLQVTYLKVWCMISLINFFLSLILLFNFKEISTYAQSLFSASFLLPKKKSTLCLTFYMFGRRKNRMLSEAEPSPG